MLIGQDVIYDGRAHVLVGVTPMSVTPFEMQLRDPVTGTVVVVQAQPRQRADGLYEVLKDRAADAGRVQLLRQQ